MSGLMKILIAEDDRHIRAGLQELLETEGYQTILAEDGESALNKFRAETPQLVLLDIMMPGRSGYEVCREIRKSHTDIPVIFKGISS